MRPGYDIHFLVSFTMIMYVMGVFATMDIMFFTFTLYISFRFELCHHLCSKIGDHSSEYNTEAKQTMLLKRIVILHVDIRKYDSYLYKKSFSKINFFSDFVIFVRKHFLL